MLKLGTPHLNLNFFLPYIYYIIDIVYRVTFFFQIFRWGVPMSVYMLKLMFNSFEECIGTCIWVYEYA